MDGAVIEMKYAGDGPEDDKNISQTWTELVVTELKSPN